MKKNIVFVGVCVAGFLAGQVLAESARPVTIVNTLRVGYDDNLYSSRSQGRKSSYFVEDVLELGYRASISAQTDFLARSRVVLISDKHENLYPNLFLMLSHAASPRLLLQVHNTLQTGDKSSLIDGRGRRYDYWMNAIGVDADYVLSERDRVGGTAKYTLERGQSDARASDFDRYDVGLSWARELLPMRTRLSVAWDHAYVDYVKSRRYNNGVDNSFHMDSFSTEVRHTFNPEWTGYVKGGVTVVDRDFFEKSTTTAPLIGSGIAYEPSPSTRLSVDIEHFYAQSDSPRHSGQQKTMLSFGAQHDITARISARSTLRFVDSEYDRKDRAAGNTPNRSLSEERIELDNRVSYRINRMHFVEVGYRHTRRRADEADNWSQNRMDLGWRVQF